MDDEVLNELLQGDCIRSAFKIYRSTKSLGSHPLAELDVVKTRRREAGYPDTEAGRGTALRDILVDAVQAMKPTGAECSIAEKSLRYYLILTEQYFQNRAPTSIASELHISRPTYFNEQKKALEIVADILYQREMQRLGNESGTSIPPSDIPPSPDTAEEQTSLPAIPESGKETPLQSRHKNLIFVLLGVALLFLTGMYAVSAWRRQIAAASASITNTPLPSATFLPPSATSSLTPTLPVSTEILNLAPQATVMVDVYAHSDLTYSGEKAQDGDLKTQWRSKDEGGEHWLSYDLGSVQLVNSFSIYYTEARGREESNPGQFEIFSSNEFLPGPWKTMEANTASSLVVGDNQQIAGQRTWCYSRPKPLRYVQLHISDPDNSRQVGISEFQVWSYPEGDLPGRNLAPEAGEVRQDSYYQYDPNLTGAKANDGRLDTKWSSENNLESHWLSYDLGNEMKVYGFVVYHAAAGGEGQGYNTQQFKVQSATSLDGPWVDEAEAVNFDQRSDRTRCYFGEGRIIRYIRLLLIDAGSDAIARIPEFEVWGEGKNYIPTPTPILPPLVNTNLASKASVSVDSYANDDWAYAGKKAQDGNLNTQWRSKDEGKEHWLSYDLGSFQLVNSFSVYYTTTLLEEEAEPSQFEIFTLNESITGSWKAIGASMTGSLTTEDGEQATGQSTWCYSIPAPLRYVELHTHEPGIGISEFQVWSYAEANFPGINLAIKAKEVQEDSYFQNDPHWIGVKANDGRLDTKWSSETVNGPHWLSYDLGDEMRVYGFVVYHAGAGGEDQWLNTQQFKVQSATSMDGAWIDEAEAVNFDQAANRTRCYFGEGRVIRYIRLLVMDAGPDTITRIPEFEVWGIPLKH